MKKRVVIVIAVIFIMLNFAFASASFTKGNKTAEIESGYSPGEFARGWINISLQNEPGSSVISGNFGGNITLYDFLDKNSVSSSNYACNPSDCGDSYRLESGQNSKSFSMSYGQEKIIAFNLTGRVVSVNDFSFRVSGKNNPACFSPVELDLLDDGWIDWRANNFSDEFTCTYQNGRGCFSSASQASERNLSATPFCEKITLLASEKFKLGAWVKKTGSDNSLITMQIYNLGGGEPLASCRIDNAGASGGDVSCNVDFSNTREKEYYVCINANKSNVHSVKSEDESPCGFYAVAGIPPPAEQEMHDYSIFAMGAKFGNAGGVEFNQKEYENQGNENELGSMIMEYLREKYAGGCINCFVNCSKGCAVPVKFGANSDVIVNVSNLDMEYSTESGEITASKIYDTRIDKPQISSGFLVLDIGYAKIPVSSAYGNQTLVISLGGAEIASKKITTAKIPVIRGISPLSVPAGVSSKFKVDAYSPANKSITEYSWDFGDGTAVEVTNTASLSHSYAATGEYTLTLGVKDSSGVGASKEFAVYAGSPRNIANITLKKYRQRITNLSQQLAGEKAWIKKIIEDNIDFSELDDKLTNLEKKFTIAASDEDYTAVMTDLGAMSVPSSVRKSGASAFPVLFESSQINLDYLNQMGAGEKDSDFTDEDYKNAILMWHDANVLANAEVYSVYAYYDAEARKILNHLNIKITAKEPDENENYLIINDNAVFDPQENVKEFGDAVGIRFLNLEDRDVEFIIGGDKNAFETEMYISPEFRELELSSSSGECNSNSACEKDLGENWKNCREDCKPWGWALFYLGLVLFFGFLIYLGLQEWYKRRYEAYLFRSRNDLYNVANFVNNSLARGMEKHEIMKNLKQAGWNSEQINYSFKKVKGKNTGMPLEIKLPKIGGGGDKNQGSQGKAFKP